MRNAGCIDFSERDFAIRPLHYPRGVEQCYRSSGLFKSGKDHRAGARRRLSDLLQLRWFHSGKHKKCFESRIFCEQLPQSVPCDCDGQSEHDRYSRKRYSENVSCSEEEMFPVARLRFFKSRSAHETLWQNPWYKLYQTASEWRFTAFGSLRTG